MLSTIIHRPVNVKKKTRQLL